MIGLHFSVHTSGHDLIFPRRFSIFSRVLFLLTRFLDVFTPAMVEKRGRFYLVKSDVCDRANQDGGTGNRREP